MSESSLLPQYIAILIVPIIQTLIFLINKGILKFKKGSIEYKVVILICLLLYITTTITMLGSGIFSENYIFAGLFGMLAGVVSFYMTYNITKIVRKQSIDHQKSERSTFRKSKN